MDTTPPADPSRAETAPPTRILITGFSGFAGGYLVAACQQRYPAAQIFGLSDHATPSSEQWLRPVTTLHGNITDGARVREVVRLAAPDLVFHLAGQASVASSWTKPAEILAVNAGGGVHLLEAIRAEQVRPRIVVVGSGELYGAVRPEENPVGEEHPLQPVNPYAVAKAAQDLFAFAYFVAYGLDVIRVRAFNHFGPRQRPAFVVADFAHQIAAIEAGLAEPVLHVGNLAAVRDFLPVEDMVLAYLAVAERGRAGAAYNTGSGRGRQIRALLDGLLAHARRRIEVREDAARMRPTDVAMLVGDITRVREDTGWQPQADFDAALVRTLEYARSQVAPA